MNIHAAPLTRFAVALSFLWVAAAPVLAQTPPPPTVTVAKPLTREIVEDDEFIGRFEAVDEVTVRARVGGYLDKVHFRDGSIVKQGDLLFTIDQRPFQTALDEAKARLDVAQTQVTFTESQFRRAEKLSETGNIPVSTLDDRRREYLAALAEVQGAKAAVLRAELDLEYTAIKAPLTGRIDRRLISAGNLVQADQTALTTIVTLDPINFYFDVDERQFLAYARDARSRNASLQEGAGGIDVTIRLSDATESPVAGKLDFAENRIDEATGTMRIRAQVPNKDLILQPGLFGRVNMPGSLPYKGILVPDEAIGADQDRRIVYVVDAENKVAAKPIRIGPRLYGYRVVRDGLTGDETIVINGLMRVRPGVTVKPELVVLPEQAGGAAQ
jgi:multidrug efflux system membrane fusion protein